MLDWRTIARLKPDHRFGMANGGWAYDAYPELATLDAGASITVAELEGPGVITNFHSTQHGIYVRPPYVQQDPIYYSRGIVLEVSYNGSETPSVRVPIGDFHGDATGLARHFTSLFVEKAPETYNSFIPMPFEHSAKVVLRNETNQNVANYSFVEWERLPAWEDDLAYLHATWRREPFQLHGDTNLHALHIDGEGAFLGRTWGVATDEPTYAAFHYVMEANNEYRLDGESRPRADYLGTEDSFGFSWGFRSLFSGLYNGINDVQHETPSRLSMYRFHGANAMRFNESLDLRLNWTYEWKDNAEFQRLLETLQGTDRGWVDYAMTSYWYQRHVGFEHGPLLPFEERVKPLLRPNPT